jgi:hypothetical protein
MKVPAGLAGVYSFPFCFLKKLTPLLLMGACFLRILFRAFGTAAIA